RRGDDHRALLQHAPLEAAMTTQTLPELTLPPRPSRLRETIAAVAVGAVVLVSIVGLDIPWTELSDIPGRVAEYLRLMFAEPNWEQVPRALFETGRSVSVAWGGATGVGVVSVRLGIVHARR